MEGFGKPPMRPAPPPDSSWESWLRDANQEIGSTTGGASAEIPTTHEVPPVEVPVQPIDPEHEKKLKRFHHHSLILASREYSRRYFIKRMQHIVNLEAQAKEKQTEISVINPKIRLAKRTNLWIRSENDALQQQLETVTGKFKVKEAEYKELLKERDSLRQLHKMQQEGLAFNSLIQPAGYSMPSDPPAQLGCQVFGSYLQPSDQPYNLTPGLAPPTVDFGLLPAPPAAADQFNIEPPQLDNLFIIDPAGLNFQSNELVSFPEFNNELSLVDMPQIIPNNGVGDGTSQSSGGMNLDNPNDSQMAPGPSSYKFM